MVLIWGGLYIFVIDFALQRQVRASWERRRVVARYCHRDGSAMEKAFLMSLYVLDYHEIKITK